MNAHQCLSSFCRKLLCFGEEENGATGKRVRFRAVFAGAETGLTNEIMQESYAESGVSSRMVEVVESSVRLGPTDPTESQTNKHQSDYGPFLLVRTRGHVQNPDAARGENAPGEIPGMGKASSTALQMREADV